MSQKRNPDNVNDLHCVLRTVLIPMMRIVLIILVHLLMG
jgi:hypothetical protein